MLYVFEERFCVFVLSRCWWVVCGWLLGGKCTQNFDYYFKLKLYMVSVLGPFRDCSLLILVAFEARTMSRQHLSSISPTQKPTQFNHILRLPGTKLAI